MVKTNSIYEFEGGFSDFTLLVIFIPVKCIECSRYYKTNRCSLTDEVLNVTLDTHHV